MIINSYKNKEIITVVIPVIIIETLEIAAWISPNSIALVVPRAWEEVPIAQPCAISLSILKNFINNGANIAPIIPVITTEIAVMEGIPPIEFETSSAIAVVIDLGINDNLIVVSSPRR